MSRQSVTLIKLTEKEIAEIFTEWERRYREEPERYQSEAVKLLKETPQTYGDACAPYFLFLLDEIRGVYPEKMQAPPKKLT